MNQEVKPADMVEEYITLRDAKIKANDVFKEFCKTNFDTRMEEIEASLLAVLDGLGVDSIAGKTGTAYKKVSTTVTIADGTAFRRHVIGCEDWDLADWRANKTRVNELIEAGEPLPPGINRSRFSTIGIRRKSQ